MMILRFDDIDDIWPTMVELDRLGVKFAIRVGDPWGVFVSPAMMAGILLGFALQGHANGYLTFFDIRINDDDRELVRMRFMADCWVPGDEILRQDFLDYMWEVQREENLINEIAESLEAEILKEMMENEQR